MISFTPLEIWEGRIYVSPSIDPRFDGIIKGLALERECPDTRDDIYTSRRSRREYRRVISLCILSITVDGGHDDSCTMRDHSAEL